jgi:diamine N-acetyltransferase
MVQGIVRPAERSDLAALGVVGPAAYAEAYAYLFPSPAAYARRLATFGEAAFLDLLDRPDARVWVAESEGCVVGFLTMVVGSRDPIQQRPNGAEVPRIYLLGPARGAGLGRALLEAAIAEARREGASHVWLDAMASADWAWRTYVKWGFRKIGAVRFDGGASEELSDMVVLLKELA